MASQKTFEIFTFIIFVCVTWMLKVLHGAIDENKEPLRVNVIEELSLVPQITFL